MAPDCAFLFSANKSIPIPWLPNDFSGSLETLLILKVQGRGAIKLTRKQINTWFLVSRIPLPPTLCCCWEDEIAEPIPCRFAASGLGLCRKLSGVIQRGDHCEIPGPATPITGAVCCSLERGAVFLCPSCSLSYTHHSQLLLLQSKPLPKQPPFWGLAEMGRDSAGHS